MTNPGPVTVGVYGDLAEASVAQSVLEAAGIASFLPDEALAGIDWRMTAALHGIRLEVAEEDAEAARLLLSGEGEIEVAAEEPADAATLTADERCPECQSPEITTTQWMRRFKALTLLLPMLLVFWPLLAAVWPRMRCGACGVGLRQDREG